MGLTNRACQTSLRLSELSTRRPAAAEFLTSVATISDGLFGDLAPFGCAVTISRSGEPSTASASSTEVVALNQSMIADDLASSLRTNTAAVLDDFRLDRRWSLPSFVIDGTHLGSVLRTPLSCLPSGILGSLTFYSPDVARFGPTEVAEAAVHATEVSIALNQALRMTRWLETAESLKLSVADRALVDTAIGIIMQSRNYTRAEAVDHVAVLAQTQYRTTAEVAAAIVRDIS